MAHVRDAFGGLHILVNNAGITGFEESLGAAHDPEHTDLADWRAVHATNPTGSFLGVSMRSA